MLNNAVYSKKIPFQTVLFDTWYSTHKIMQHVDSLGKYYYAPIKANRNVSKTHDSKPYKAVKELTFSDEEIRHGVEIHIKGFAKISMLICLNLLFLPTELSMLLPITKLTNLLKLHKMSVAFDG